MSDLPIEVLKVYGLPIAFLFLVLRWTSMLWQENQRLHERLERLLEERCRAVELVLSGRSNERAVSTNT